MAVRIRKSGEILCAALHPELPEDIYVDDALHYILSVKQRLLVTEDWEGHSIRGQWWWKGEVPEGVQIDPFYSLVSV